jgi:hypothetical protein
VVVSSLGTLQTCMTCVAAEVTFMHVGQNQIRSTPN